VANKLRIVRFEVFTAMTMKNIVFWDVAPCGVQSVTCLTGNLVFFTCPEDGGDMFLRNVGSKQSHTVLHPPEDNILQVKN
jgi:hypothetical protein